MDKKYYVIGPRNAWDTVDIGLFESYRDAVDNLSYPNDKNIIREATPQEIEAYLREQVNGSTMFDSSGASQIFDH